MRRYSSRKPYHQREPILNSEISRGILAVLLFIVAGLSALSFFSLAGVAGNFIDSFLSIVFGQVRYVFPLVLIIVAVLMLRDLEYEYRPTHWLGAVLFFLSFNGLIHLQKPISEMPSLAMQGFGGGLSGLILSWPLLKYLNYWGAVVVLTGALLVAVIFLFNTSLARIVNLHKQLFLLLGWFGRQIISFFSLFKKDGQLRFKINGEYNAKNNENFEDDDAEKTAGEEEIEEEKRAFKQKALNKKDDEESDSGKDEKEENDFERERKNKVVIRDLPPLDLLSAVKSKPTSGDIKSNAAVIKDTLQNFGIEVDMGEVRVGPTVTQYSFKPAKGIKLNRITALNNDLSLSLAAHPIRIEAPIPGQSLVGIEVPNQKVAMVTLKELLECSDFKERRSSLTIALGKDVSGKILFGDLGKMPHLLIAGATGSGKTVCINSILLSLLYQNTAETLRLIMVDPKRVELTLYNSIPHLLTPVITDPGKTVNALRWVIGEMDRRFNMLAQSAKRDIDSYNSVAEEKMPFIVFVIDELADLMLSAASEVEAGIIRIAQMARAVGIHLIVATQRPSVDIITGLMKANIPARIAFSVASLVDSRTILDCPGAEKLLGRGDMLYLTAELSKPKRIQGAYISDEEIKRVVNYLKGDEPPRYDDSVVSRNNFTGNQVNLFGDDFNSGTDSLFNEAKRVVIESGKASASLLQRRLKVGYARAARLLDEMEEAGIVGPADGAKPREVFLEHLEHNRGDIVDEIVDNKEAEEKKDEEIPPEDQTNDSGGTVLD
ncbi:MAG: DNA translocase FtsK 4TM domain-containing protein [Patescibacteria group bacterium]|nr:DNA translocase FtsK 4TM domain-containing protein [Patescibacteria group bacterium]